MPKLHLIVAHALEMVDMLGSLGAISEQAFENYQSTSYKQRFIHSKNKCNGPQIAEDLIYGWLRSSPDVQDVLMKHEERLSSQKSGLKTRRYSM